MNACTLHYGCRLHKEAVTSDSKAHAFKQNIKCLWSVKPQIYSVSACLQISTTLCALFPWNCTLARRHNLTFQKGRLPTFKGLHIDSSWWLTDFSLAKNDLTKEFPQDPRRCARGKANSRPRSAWYVGGDVWQAAINPQSGLAGGLCLLSHQTFFMTRPPPPPTSREHFTSWICRWQTQLNPQPLLIAALAWQSHCGSRWCPLGVLQRQGDRTRENEQRTGSTRCISTQLNHAVSTQQEHWHLCESQMNHLMYSSMDLSYSLSYKPH